MNSNKRTRESPPSAESSSPSPSSSPAPKASRIEATGSTHPLLCTLPPTCNSTPTPLASVRDLEAHYATYHAYVCEERGCHCVFPDARLLELHQTECHNPFAAIKQERGEKIFACHLASCPKLCRTFKSRRLHLIEAHGYPKEYLFTVTNHGVGQLLKQWGEGASMLRETWKPREGQTKEDKKEKRVEEKKHTKNLETTQDHDDIDALTSSVQAMSLGPVPSTIRFGRGGSREGFAKGKSVKFAEYHDVVPRGATRGRGGGRDLFVPPRARGRSGRGRGVPYQNRNVVNS